MKRLIVEIANYSRKLSPNFVIIGQNVPQLLMLDECSDGSGRVDPGLIAAIDGWSITDVFYGHDQDNQPSSANMTKYWLNFLQRLKASGKKALTVDFCWSFQNMARSFYENNRHGLVSTVAYRSLANIPGDNVPSIPLNRQNTASVKNLNDVQNWLYLIDSQYFTSKFDFLFKINMTMYDMFVISPYFQTSTKIVSYTARELNSIKTKKNGGGKRLVICYLSIAEAAHYMPYWKSSWLPCNGFMDDQNPDFPGEYRVKYWELEWKKILYGTNESLIDSFIASGCDGAYLDGTDVYLYFKSGLARCAQRRLKAGKNFLSNKQK